MGNNLAVARDAKADEKFPTVTSIQIDQTTAPSDFPRMIFLRLHRPAWARLLGVKIVVPIFLVIEKWNGRLRGVPAVLVRRTGATGPFSCVVVLRAEGFNLDLNPAAKP